MFDLLGETEVPTLIVVTKADKLSRAAAKSAVAGLAQALRVDEEQILPFSAVSGEGRDELAEAVVSLVAEASVKGETA
jgi:GTP-binding protein